MNRFIIILLVSFLFLAPLSAQEAAPEQSEAVKKAQREQRKVQRGMMKVLPHLAPMIGKIMTEKSDILVNMQYSGMNKDAFHKYVGLTEEQVKQVEKNQKEFGAGIGLKIMPLMAKVSNAQSDEDYAAVAKEMEKIGFEAFDTIEKQQDELFTPAQKTKLAELCIQSNQQNALAPMTFRAYEILELSDAQREQLEQIKVEYVRAFEELFNKMIDLQGKIMLPANDDDNFTQEKFQERTKQFETERKSLEAEGEQLKNRTKARVLVMLDKAQQEKLDAIVAKTPEFVVKRRPGATEPKNDDWKKSWKPGDPIPEDAKEEESSKQRRGFPFRPM